MNRTGFVVQTSRTSVASRTRYFLGKIAPIYKFGIRPRRVKGKKLTH